MPRPPRPRCVSWLPEATLFKPAGVPARLLEQVRLGLDELEAMRLCDLESLEQAAAAERMGVSRQTVGRLLERGRAAVAEALTAGKAILIEGGPVQVAAEAAGPGPWGRGPAGGAGGPCGRGRRGPGCGQGRERGRGRGPGRAAGQGYGQGPAGEDIRETTDEE